MLKAAKLWRGRKARAEEPSLEADLRQVLIMAGAITSLGLMALSGVAALVRDEPRPPAPDPSAAAPAPAGAPQLAVATDPQRADAERRDDRERAARGPARPEPVRLRGTAPSAGPEAAVDAVATTPPDLSLAPPPAPEIVTREAEEAQQLEAAPFLRGGSEPAAEVVPPPVLAQPVTEAATPEARSPSLRERLNPRTLAGRVIPGLRPRAAASDDDEDDSQE